MTKVDLLARSVPDAMDILSGLSAKGAALLGVGKSEYGVSASGGGRAAGKVELLLGAVEAAVARAGRRVRTSVSGDTQRECIRPSPPRTSMTAAAMMAAIPAIVPIVPKA